MSDKVVRAAAEGRLDSACQVPGLLDAGGALMVLLERTVGFGEEPQAACGLSDADCYRVCAWTAALLRPAADVIAVAGGRPGAAHAEPADCVTSAALYLPLTCRAVKMLLLWLNL